MFDATGCRFRLLFYMQVYVVVYCCIFLFVFNKFSSDDPGFIFLSSAWFIASGICQCSRVYWTSDNFCSLTITFLICRRRKKSLLGWWLIWNVWKTSKWIIGHNRWICSLPWLCPKVAEFLCCLGEPLITTKWLMPTWYHPLWRMYPDLVFFSLVFTNSLHIMVMNHLE